MGYKKSNAKASAKRMKSSISCMVTSNIRCPSCWGLTELMSGRRTRTGWERHWPLASILSKRRLRAIAHPQFSASTVAGAELKRPVQNFRVHGINQSKLCLLLHAELYWFTQGVLREPAASGAVAEKFWPGYVIENKFVAIVVRIHSLLR